jgi:hypothetical protein
MWSGDLWFVPLRVSMNGRRSESEQTYRACYCALSHTVLPMLNPSANSIPMSSARRQTRPSLYCLCVDQLHGLGVPLVALLPTLDPT